MESVAQAKESDTGPVRRILCIDGGGILGTFPAAFLASIESELDRPIAEYFDLIAGTSTGGILAIGLGMGLTAAEVLDLYERRGPEIFGAHANPLINRALGISRTLRRVVSSKYTSDGLRTVLGAVLGNRRLGESRTRLVIPAWDPACQTVYIYKTAHHPRLKRDYKALAIDAALATSAAPTFFREHVTGESVGLIDGGVWANNPIAIAVVEAIGLLGWNASQLRVLSLGCLAETYSLPKSAGLSTIGLKLTKLFMDGQSHGAMGMAKLLTGHEHYQEAVFRIDQVVPSNKFEMDDVRMIPDLKGMGYAKARDRISVLSPVFFEQSAEPFIPEYQLMEE